MSIKRTRFRIIAVAGAASVVAALGTVTYTASAAENPAASNLVPGADQADGEEDCDDEVENDVEEDESAAEDCDEGGDNNADDVFPGTPDTLKPPAGAELVGNAAVETGVQVYNCVNGVFAQQPVPDASLTGSIGLVDLTDGPQWKSTDGSLVQATLTEQVDQFESIPQQLLRVTEHGGVKGKMSDVGFIQQLNTSGGARPIGNCERQENVEFSAIYLFWTAP